MNIIHLVLIGLFELATVLCQMIICETHELSLIQPYTKLHSMYLSQMIWKVFSIFSLVLHLVLMSLFLESSEFKMINCCQFKQSNQHKMNNIHKCTTNKNLMEFNKQIHINNVYYRIVIYPFIIFHLISNIKIL